MMRVRGRLVSIFILGTLSASTARAHLTNSGLGPFYDGLSHLFLTPEDLLAVVALSLFAGLRGPKFGRTVLFALPAAYLLGAVAGWSIAGVPLALPGATAVVTIALASLVVIDPRLPLGAVAACAVGLGLFNGVMNGMELASAEASALVAAGMVVSLFIVVTILAGYVVTLRAMWARVAIRVAGSWIAASGLFMLGWAVRTR